MSVVNWECGRPGQNNVAIRGAEFTCVLCEDGTDSNLYTTKRYTYRLFNSALLHKCINGSMTNKDVSSDLEWKPECCLHHTDMEELFSF